MTWLSMLKNSALFGLLVAAVVLAACTSVLTKRLEAAQLQNRQQLKDLAQQAGLIATLQTQDAQNRVLMATQLQQEQQLRQQARTNERKYRDAIKDDECAARDMPGAVIELLRPDTKSSTAAAYPAPP
ncbi:hypothetical protein [Serratia fonticola]|uniref:hypothetical protein n=1 Tax=Serratia fonticola TaxID=47917 RepID=UPI003AAA5310